MQRGKEKSEGPAIPTSELFGRERAVDERHPRSSTEGPRSAGKDEHQIRTTVGGERLVRREDPLDVLLALVARNMEEIGSNSSLAFALDRVDVVIDAVMNHRNLLGRQAEGPNHFARAVFRYTDDLRHAGGEAARELRRTKVALTRRGGSNLFGVWEQLLNLIEGLASLGERRDAAGLYPFVSKGLENGVVISLNSRLWQMVAGIAASCGEQWDKAQEHFETALRQAHELPHKIAQPEVRRWYAQMLLDRNAPGDRDKARTMLGEATGMYRTIGMPKHLEMVEKMSEAL